jgi:hypothetical protein
MAILFSTIALWAGNQIVNAQGLTNNSEQILSFVVDKCQFEGFKSIGSGTMRRNYKIKDGKIATDANGKYIIDNLSFINLAAEKSISDKSGITALITVHIDGVRQEENNKFKGTSSLSVEITDTDKAKVKSVEFTDENHLLMSLTDGRQYLITCESIQKAIHAK